MTTSEMTPADLAAVTGSNNNGWMGGDGAWWIIILFLFVFTGCGGNFGGNRSSSGAADNYVLASDFATVQRQIDAAADRLGTQNVAISNGLCEGFYTQAQLVNGVNSNLMNQGYETRNAITQAQITEMQNNNALQASLANCCCENRQAISGVNYNMATNTAALQNTLCSNTRDILENQNANARAILDALNAQQMEAKNAEISRLNSEVQALNLAQSQAAQNNYLISQLRPAPVPAFSVNAPYMYSGCGCQA